MRLSMAISRAEVLKGVEKASMVWGPLANHVTGNVSVRASIHSGVSGEKADGFCW